MRCQAGKKVWGSRLGFVAGGRGSSDRERRRWSRTQVDWENLVGQVSG